MTFLSRQFHRETDLPRLVAFVTGPAGKRGPIDGYMHLGDLLWCDFLVGLMPPVDRWRLWDDVAGELAGYSFSWAPSESYCSVRPDLKPTSARWELLDLMIEWQIELTRLVDPAASVKISELASDDLFAQWIAGKGFSVSAQPPSFLFVRDMSLPIQPVSPPEGWEVRSLTGPAEVGERVAIHAEVWHPSKLTAPAFSALRESAGFSPELDLVAANADGEFGAYATLWHDPVNHTSEFEPVGARERHRGKGLAKAVLTEGLIRARALGVETAFVYTDEPRVAARRLYESVGFKIVDQWHTYERAV